MSVLGREDIIRELGNNIYIYPIRDQNIKGGTINLSASTLAWSLRTKLSIYNRTTKKIIIAPNDTALIETQETIYVSSKICGTYHSKCGIVSKGLGHIGTTLDPGYIGPSLIAVHNHSNQGIEINPNDTFVSVTFHYLNKKTKKANTNNSGQDSLLTGIKLNKYEKQWLDEDYQKDPSVLKKKMKSDQAFKETKKKSISWMSIFYSVVYYALAFVLTVGLFFYLKNKYFPDLNVQMLLVLWFGIFIAKGENLIKTLRETFYV